MVINNASLSTVQGSNPQFKENSMAQSGIHDNQSDVLSRAGAGEVTKALNTLVTIKENQNQAQS